MFQIVNVTHDQGFTGQKGFHHQRHLGHDGLHHVGRDAGFVVTMGNKAILSIGSNFTQRRAVQVQGFGDTAQTFADGIVNVLDRQINELCGQFGQ